MKIVFIDSEKFWYFLNKQYMMTHIVQCKKKNKINQKVRRILLVLVSRYIENTYRILKYFIVIFNENVSNMKKMSSDDQLFR